MGDWGVFNQWIEDYDYRDYEDPLPEQQDDEPTKGDDSTLAWRNSSIQADLDALNSKKTAWLAKEADANDTSSYTAVLQPE